MQFPVSSTFNSVFRLFFISTLFVSSLFATNDTIYFPTQKHCIHDHFSALLNLKLGFDFSNDSIAALPSWNPNNTNCCSWEGITCIDTTGHVNGLDLSNSHVSGRIDYQILFNIRSLQRLNLASFLPSHGVSFFPSPIPSGFDQLTGLTHLNLSRSSSFSGQIPLGISRLTGLVSLDLSYSYFILMNQNLHALVQNLSNLRELHLDGLIIGTTGSEWGQALSSALPGLQKLSLSGCNLWGPVPSSFSKLQSLSELDLSRNNLSSEIPRFAGNCSSSSSPLNLTHCELNGKFPYSIFWLPNLRILNLSHNPYLNSYLPEFPRNNSLQKLLLSGSGFSGKLPDSVGNLKLLTDLDLSGNHFSGQPGEFHNASTSLLESIFLDGNDFRGPIPRWIFQLPHLTTLDLSRNNFSGVVDLSLFKNLKQMRFLDLSDNNLFVNNEGSNSSFMSSPKMWYLSLRSCGMRKFPDVLKGQKHLAYLDISNNKINGKIPKWIWNVRKGGLEYLNLSHNALEGFEGPLPHPSSLSSLEFLDLSSNMLRGSLPSLIFKVTSLVFIDFSNNKFSGSLNQTFRKGSKLQSLRLNGNQLEGPLSRSLAHCIELEVLDLAENQINDTFPFWLQNLPELRILNFRSNQFYGSIGDATSTVTSLNIFDVSSNSLTGSLPSNAFKVGCKLLFLNLNRNRLEGPLPQTLANCTALMFLDLGENKINGAFPFWLQNLWELCILNLRSNQFYGNIGHGISTSTFLRLRIFDISSNSFTGSLPSNVFKGWKEMIDNNNSELFPHFQISDTSYSGLMLVDEWVLKDFWSRTEAIEEKYQQALNLTMKNVELKYAKVPDGFAFIDLSNNGFEGNIPESIGNLKLLRSLNMSHNNFTGRIPASIGNLTNLEALDLSQNNLRGEIPGQLADVTSLAVLNLSYNTLTGSIPQVRQFLTFNDYSFLGNPGLCGSQISRKCGEVKAPAPAQQSADDDEYDWRIIWIAFGVGYGVGWGALYWTLALWRDGRRRFYLFFDSMFSLIFSSVRCFF